MEFCCRLGVGKGEKWGSLQRGLVFVVDAAMKRLDAGLGKRREKR